MAKKSPTLATAKSEAPGYANKKYNRVMLNGHDNENGKKRVYLAKNNFARLLSTLFLHFFAVVWHDYNVKLLSYTFYEGNVVCVPVRFFLKPSFTPLWPLAFLNFSPPLQNFQIFLPTKSVSFVSYLSVRGGVGGQFPRNV